MKQRQPAAVDAAEGEAGEVRTGQFRTFGWVARHQLQQRAAGVGLDLHHLAAAAAKQQPRGAVAAQEGQGLLVAHAQAGEQAAGGVGAAGDVAARQRHVVRRQRHELLGQAGGFDDFGQHTLRQSGWIRRQRGHGHRRDAKTRHQRDRRRDDAQAVPAGQCFEALPGV